MKTPTNRDLRTLYKLDSYFVRKRDLDGEARVLRFSGRAREARKLRIAKRDYLTFIDWLECWEDYWNLRDSHRLARIDPAQPWTAANVYLQNLKAAYVRQMQARPMFNGVPRNRPEASTVVTNFVTSSPECQKVTINVTGHCDGRGHKTANYTRSTGYKPLIYNTKMK